MLYGLSPGAIWPQPSHTSPILVVGGSPATFNACFSALTALGAPRVACRGHHVFSLHLHRPGLLLYELIKARHRGPQKETFEAKCAAAAAGGGGYLRARDCWWRWPRRGGGGEGGGCEGDGGGEDWAESESEGAPVEEPVLDELAMDGDDGEGGEADAHDAAAAAADAAADAAALAAAKAAVAQPLPALPADAQIAAASLGVHRLQLRAMHEGFQQSLLAKPGMLFNLAVSEAFATAGLSERDRNAMRRWYTSGVGAACSGCPCPNHTSQVLWGEQRRATAVSMQVECDSLCAPLFLTITRNDSSLGENSKELELVNIIFCCAAPWSGWRALTRTRLAPLCTWTARARSTSAADAWGSATRSCFFKAPLPLTKAGTRAPGSRC